MTSPMEQAPFTWIERVGPWLLPAGLIGLALLVSGYRPQLLALPWSALVVALSRDAFIRETSTALWATLPGLLINAGLLTLAVRRATGLRHIPDGPWLQPPARAAAATFLYVVLAASASEALLAPLDRTTYDTYSGPDDTFNNAIGAMVLAMGVPWVILNIGIFIGTWPDAPYWVLQVADLGWALVNVALVCVVGHLCSRERRPASRRDAANTE